MVLTIGMALFAVHEECDDKARDNFKGERYWDRKGLFCV